MRKPMKPETIKLLADIYASGYDKTESHLFTAYVFLIALKSWYLEFFIYHYSVYFIDNHPLYEVWYKNVKDDIFLLCEADSEGSIWDKAAVIPMVALKSNNNLFRVWHDYLHYENRADWSIQGELETYQASVKHSKLLFEAMKRPYPPALPSLLFSEIVLQACHADQYGFTASQKVVTL